MIHAGDTIENPVTGERIVFNKTSAETGGEARETLVGARPRSHYERALAPWLQGAD